MIPIKIANIANINLDRLTSFSDVFLSENTESKCLQNNKAIPRLNRKTKVIIPCNLNGVIDHFLQHSVLPEPIVNPISESIPISIPASQVLPPQVPPETRLPVLNLP